MRLCFGGSVGARGVRPKSLVGSWTVFLIAECAGWEDGCRLTHTQNSREGGAGGGAVRRLRSCPQRHDVSQSSESSQSRDYPRILTSPQRQSHGQLLHKTTQPQHAEFPPNRVEVTVRREAEDKQQEISWNVSFPVWLRVVSHIFVCLCDGTCLLTVVSYRAESSLYNVSQQQHASANSARVEEKFILYSVLRRAKSAMRHAVLPALVSLSAFLISSS